MSVHPRTTTPGAAVAPGGRRPGAVSRLVGALARSPLPIVVALLLLGAVLASLQQVWIDHVMSTGAPEPQQWVAQLTVKQANVLIPVALIALWARRRGVQTRLGAVAAAMVAVLPMLHLFLTVAALVWGGILGRGDLEYPFMHIEWLMLVAFLGLLLGGIAWMLDPGASRWIGPLIIVGFVMNYVTPWGMTIVYAALGVVILRTRLLRRRAAVATRPAVS